MVKALKITAIVVFLLILAFFGVQAWLGGKIKSVIEQQGSQFNGGTYDVTVDRSTVNIFSRSATLKGVRIKPDSACLVCEDKPEMIIDVSIDGVYASGLNLKMLRKGSGAKLRGVEIDRPLITADIYKAAGEDSVKAALQDTSEVSKPFDLPLRRISIDNGNIIVRQHSEEGTSYTEADGLDVAVKLIADNFSDTLSIREMFSGRLSLRSLLMTNADSSVDTRLDSLSYDAGQGELKLASVSVEPKYPMAQFVYKSARHTDWTRLAARGVYIAGLDAVSIDGTPVLNADSIYIASGLVDSYKDRNAQVPYRFKKLFFESVQDLPLLLDIGVITIGGMEATYRELPQYGIEPGVINFTRLGGTFRGLTNIPSSEEPFYTLAAHAYLYGAAPLQATFWFPKSKETNRFEVRGSLGSMDMTRLNRTVIPLAKAEVEQGTIDALDFHITGGSWTASVDMTLLYHGLKIALVKRNGDNEIRERKFLSWIANEFVVKDSNPDGNGTRHGAGSAERDPDRSQFNFLWRTLLAGIKESAGL